MNCNSSISTTKGMRLSKVLFAMTKNICRPASAYVGLPHNSSTTETTSTQNLRFVPKTSGQWDARKLQELCDFIRSSKKLFVLTGAGISTESGIRDYRSEKVGLYAVSKDRPIQYQDFLKNPKRRHRYWARNFLGWQFFSNKLPNRGHVALAEMERTGKVHWLVTQNVDGLHLKADSRKVTELHGTAARVQCMECQAEYSRHGLQNELLAINKRFNAQPKLEAPDGDVTISDNVLQSFRMVPCQQCGGVLKPKIVFFGEDIPKQRKEFAHSRLEESDAVLVVGSSLTVFSSYRMITMANKLKLPIAIVNIGPTRGDHLASLHVNAICGDVLDEIVKKKLY